MNTKMAIVFIVGIVSSFFLGSALGTRFGPSTEMISKSLLLHAKDNNLNSTILFGKGAGIKVIDLKTGNEVLSCDRTECRTEIRFVDGKPIPIDKTTGKPPKGLKIVESYLYSYKGSHCEGSWSGGVHTENCCNDYSCWF